MSNETASKNEYLVEVNNLQQYFPIKVGLFKSLPLKAVDGFLLHQTRGDAGTGWGIRLWEDHGGPFSAETVYPYRRRGLFRRGEGR